MSRFTKCLIFVVGLFLLAPAVNARRGVWINIPLPIPAPAASPPAPSNGGTDTGTQLPPCGPTVMGCVTSNPSSRQCSPAPNPMCNVLTLPVTDLVACHATECNNPNGMPICSCPNSPATLPACGAAGTGCTATSATRCSPAPNPMCDNAPGTGLEACFPMNCDGLPANAMFCACPNIAP